MITNARYLEEGKIIACTIDGVETSFLVDLGNRHYQTLLQYQRENPSFEITQYVPPELEAETETQIQKLERQLAELKAEVDKLKKEKP